MGSHLQLAVLTHVFNDHYLVLATRRHIGGAATSQNLDRRVHGAITRLLSSPLAELALTVRPSRIRSQRGVVDLTYVLRLYGAWCCNQLDS